MEVARLAAAVFLCILPVTLVVPVLKPLVQDRFAVGDLATSAFMAVNMLGATLAAPLAGALSDRLGRRKPVVLAALLADALLLAALPAAPSFATLLLLRAAEGAAHIAALSLLMAMAADRARAAGSGRMMGAVGATLTLGVALGAPLGGRLGALDPELPLLAGAALAALAAALVAATLRDAPAAPAGGGVRASLALLAQDRRQLVPCAFAFVDRFTVGFFVTAFPLFLGNVHGAGPARIGGLLALFLLPFALLCYPLGRLAERGSLAWFIGAGSVAYGLLVAAVGLVPAGALPALMLGLGLVSGVMFVPTLMLASELAGPGRRALAMGAFNAAGSAGFLVGPLVAGAVTEAVAAARGAPAGYAAAFAVAGAAELLCVLATLPALARLRRGAA